MVIFKFKVKNPEQCRLLMEFMDLPGEYIDNEDEDGGPYKKVWDGDEFAGIFSLEDRTFELYGRKNTNSINYYQKRFPKLEYDDVIKVPTKRW